MSTVIDQAIPKVMSAEERAKRPWVRFRLRRIGPNGQLVGRHEQRDKDGRDRSYPPGAVLESQEDLADRWPEKFEIVRDEIPQRPEDVKVPAGYKLVKDDSALREQLDAMSMDELLAMAADDEVEVQSTDKASLVEALLAARS